MVNRDQSTFRGTPDPHPFNRNDLAMMEAVMNRLGINEGRLLALLQELMQQDMPRFIESRGMAFDSLRRRSGSGWGPGSRSCHGLPHLL